MAGAWKSTRGETVIEEVWTAPRGGMLLGLNRTVGPRGASWEHLRIAEDEDGVVYWASPSGAKPTPFRLVELEENRAVFSNPEHDFPQRLTYTRTDEQLVAKVEAEQNGRMQGFELRWELVAELE